MIKGENISPKSLARVSEQGCCIGSTLLLKQYNHNQKKKTHEYHDAQDLAKLHPFYFSAYNALTLHQKGGGHSGQNANSEMVQH